MSEKTQKNIITVYKELNELNHDKVNTKRDHPYIQGATWNK